MTDFQAYILSVTFVASLALVIMAAVALALVRRIVPTRERDQ